MILDKLLERRLREILSSEIFGSNIPPEKSKSSKASI